MTGTTSRAAAAARTITGRPAGFWRDLTSVAIRALRQIPREPEAIVPALVIPCSSSSSTSARCPTSRPRPG